jgi:hypothetical protein
MKYESKPEGLHYCVIGSITLNSFPFIYCKTVFLQKKKKSTPKVGFNFLNRLLFCSQSVTGIHKKIC